MEATPIRLTQEVLRTDLAGMPLEWIDYRSAATLYHSEQVAYACGSPIYRVHGGYNARTGLRSIIEVNSIIATRGDTHNVERTRAHYTPPLNNTTLFKRDANICMYCGSRFSKSDLTRDHITPISHGGQRYLDECCRCLSALQQSERWPHARTGKHGTTRGTIHPNVCRVHLPEGSPSALRSNAVPARALPANESFAQATARRHRASYAV